MILIFMKEYKMKSDADFFTTKIDKKKRKNAANFYEIFMKMIFFRENRRNAECCFSLKLPLEK